MLDWAFIPTFGLRLEYDASWVGRYQSLETDLATYNINPAISWKINEKLSVGGGINAQYADATLSQALDFGTLLGVSPGALDGKSTVEGDDWAWGVNLGVLYVPTEKTRIGVSYRSRIDHELKGKVTFEVPAAASAIQAQDIFVNTGVEAELNLPDNVSVGLYQQLTDAFALTANLTWMSWSRFEELRVEYDSSQPDSVTEENWEDTWRGSVGINFSVSPKWMIRAGAAYDQTPVPDEKHRTPKLPDADRIFLGFGFEFYPKENIEINLAVMQVFFKDSEIDHLGSFGDRLIGSYEADTTVISAQVNLKF